ncbi:AMP-binding protein [Mycobacterium kansasii]|uniref:Acetyl-coenzyme A synthetase n=3 Tax=Mycobacterium kansasii TaxID=1768 RepID=A0A653ERU4_MYCKA|nr:AMP-binding protein [Mycobacterium kansasii]UCA21140.1 AMP-binding protein [Mycobacterium kansasii]UGT81191.1 AMP-binding protein [Mycobacterium kansasii]UGT85469.1 AMP-binding protein [Mycobacterium kansasii]UGU26295.1 AMP-binding protein [Mycobacterium kansasii]VAZ62578.1 Acetyl-coenzyme A synthetase [Mycobacterium kansasii]
MYPLGERMNSRQRVDELREQFSDAHADVAWLLCDRHPAQRIAFTVVGDGGSVSMTFGELATASHRSAQAFRAAGVRRGDRVATLMGKSVDLVVTILATWRLGAVYVPLFTAFGADAIAERLERSGAVLVVADPDQRHKLAPSAHRTVLVTGAAPVTPDGDRLLADAVAAAAPEPVDRVAVGGDGALVHMFTSGTTGKPKGVVHPVAYLAGFQAYLEYSLGVTSDDSFWCAADPGWAYGLYTAIAAPMAAGISSILLRGGFSAESTWRTLSEHRVTNFAAAPTVFRSLRASSTVLPADLHLARASSAGEPLTAEVNEWARRALGLLVHDHFGQTELGMVMGNHHHPELARPVKPGSMGRPLPGWSVTVLGDDDRPAPPGVLGRVAIDVAASPLLTFTGYQDQAHGGRFSADRRYYLTGDIARVDDDGDFFFFARDDDVIIMAGYRIGPADVESVLSRHPAVAECCVVAAPDEVRGEVIEAYVVLRGNHPRSAELPAELQRFVKDNYAAHAYPRQVHFVDELPKTSSGKVQRSVLRRQRQEAAEPQTT